MSADHLAETVDRLESVLEQVVGFIYPNEIELQWSLLIVIYPYITGLVAGAFILASLEKIMNVKEVTPTYRLSLLTALAFLIVAPLPLLAHLGHIERAHEIFFTPNLSSAMAMFGFVYAWYLAAVLLLEIWFEYRKDMILWSREESGLKKWFYRCLALFSTDISDEAVAFDHKAARVITMIGIPSAFILHGYVGFIFGSIKANPWWSSVLIPIVFLASAIVSGIGMVMLLYMIITPLRYKKIDMVCLNKLAEFLLLAIIIDFSLEMLDFIHRLYEAEESIKILSQMISSKLMISLVVVQLLLGTLVPAISLAFFRFTTFPDEIRKLVYFLAGILVQVGIFSTRWNVVIGGQLFSKSLRGLTVYKMTFFGLEGLFISIILLVLPFFLLYFLIRILPPWRKAKEAGQS